jgi:hypothetical protein
MLPELSKTIKRFGRTLLPADDGGTQQGAEADAEFWHHKVLSASMLTVISSV